MSEHTQGKWKFTYTDEDEAHCGYIITKVSTNYPVAFVAAATPNTTSKSNARLIAAAPEMKDVLEEILDTLKDHYDYSEAYGEEPARESPIDGASSLIHRIEQCLAKTKEMEA